MRRGAGVRLGRRSLAAENCGASAGGRGRAEAGRRRPSRLVVGDSAGALRAQRRPPAGRRAAGRSIWSTCANGCRAPSPRLLSRRRGGPRPRRRPGPSVAARPQLRAVTRRRRPGRRGLGRRRFRPQGQRTLEIAGRGREGRGALAARRDVQTGELSAALAGALDEQAKAGRTPPSRRLGRAATSPSSGDLGGLRAARPTRPGRPRRRRRIAQRLVSSATSSRPAATPTALACTEARAAAAQRPAGADARSRARSTGRSATAGRRGRARPPEVEARLAVRTAEERANAVRGRADSLRRRGRRRTRGPAACAARAGERASTRRRSRRAVAESGRLVAADDSAARWRSRHRARDDRGRRASAPAQRALTKARGDEVNELAAQDRPQLTDAVHRDEVAKAQSRAAHRAARGSTSSRASASAVADLIAEYGPDVRCRPSALEMAEYEQAKERGEQVTAPAADAVRPADPGAPGQEAPSASSPHWAR